MDHVRPVFAAGPAPLDVRDFGAIGDGLADDSAALISATRAAGRRGIAVPPGAYRLTTDLTVDGPARIVGRIIQPADKLFILTENLDLPSYIAAFGREAGPPKAFAALFAIRCDATLDFRGETVVLDAPFDFARYVPAGLIRFRRGLRRGRISVRPGPRWLSEEDDVLEECRRRYALDLSGFTEIGEVVVNDLTLDLAGCADGIRLPRRRGAARFSDLVVAEPSGCGLADLATGHAPLDLDGCRFIARREAAATGITTSGAPVRFRGCRFERLEPAAVLSGDGHFVSACHFVSPRETGISTALVLARRNARCKISGSVFDGTALIWTDEPDPTAEGVGAAAFAGVTITGNQFTAAGAAAHEAWIVLRSRYERGGVRDLTVTNNQFVAANGVVERAERMETAAGLAATPAAAAGLSWTGNLFVGVERRSANPVTLDFAQRMAEPIWWLDAARRLPFGAAVATVAAARPIGRLLNEEGAAHSEGPAIDIDPTSGLVRLGFSRPVCGRMRVTLTAACDDQ